MALNSELIITVIKTCSFTLSILYSFPLNFFSSSEYTIIRFITSRGEGSPVSQSGGGGDKATLNKRAPLGRRVTLGEKSTF